MGDRNEVYRYQAHASLVIQGDRKYNKEPTGEAETLKGRIALEQMGDRVGQSRPVETRPSKKKSGRSTTTQEESLYGLYIPKTKETKLIFDELLSTLTRFLGDQPRDVLHGAADEVLAIVKNPEIIAGRKHIECSKLLADSLSDADFSLILRICSQINDFGEANDIEDSVEEDTNQEIGVAVVFDDSEDDSDNGDLSQMEASSDDDDSGVLSKRTTTTSGRKVEKELLNVHEIDAHWIQRQVGKYYEDATESQLIASQVLEILSESDDRTCENKLVVLLDFDKFELIKMLLKNKSKIFYCVRLKQAKNESEREAVESEMKGNPAGSEIVALLSRAPNAAEDVESEDEEDHDGRTRIRDVDDDTGLVFESMADLIDYNDSVSSTVKTLDLSDIAFVDGDHTMTNKEVKLPAGSWRKQEKGFEEVHVPPLKQKPFTGGESLINIDEMPEWMHPAFKGMNSLNRIQSRIYSTAIGKDINLLVCAPTGAGKTNVAMLTLLHEVGKFYDDKTKAVDLKRMKAEMKLVYIAPMKALVQEVVSNFSQRLTAAYGIVVRELSGDQQLSRSEIAETQLIVTTPEKWDIVTRKAGDRAYTQLVRLVIIDEIHLLHNERGAVLEAIVARNLRQQELTQQAVRLVGISATLPNYQDVALFLRVPLDTGLFFFDNSFRPVPLQQQYIGITETKAIKRFQKSNEICYDKTIAALVRNPNDQLLIFVHSRKETAKTCRAMYELAMERNELDKFLSPDKPEAREVLQTEVEENVQSKDLKEFLPYGFAVHHAGMSRSDRNLVEDLFKAGYIKSLVCTATLAWGVNLPAHSVIIKGTQVYDPSKGRWTELSQLDLLQMLGRAGRPQYDTEGEGIIITTHKELQFYLSLINCQLPIESQLVSKLADCMNAEVVMGTIQSIADAAKWIRYTYLYVRMARNPQQYGITLEEYESDKSLLAYRLNLAHTAAMQLDKSQLVRYDRRTGHIQVTPLGRVSAHYYIPHDSMEIYNEFMKPNMGDIDIFHLFSLSKEFSNIIVRNEEKMELVQLGDKVPIPIKESIEEPSAKVNVLLQSYISGLKLDGYALACDLVFIHQSAGRIVRALFEIALLRGWADVALRLLDLANMVEHRIWTSQTFLRQLKGGLSKSVLMKLERTNLSVSQYFAFSPAELGELFGGGMQNGKVIHKLIHCFPKLEVTAEIQPITRSVLKVDLNLVPDFQFDEKYCGGALPFWIIVEDGDGEKILHCEQFVLKKSTSEMEFSTTFTVPLSDPLAPNYFCKVVCDRFLHSVTELPISFRKLILPEKFPPHTKLLDLQPLPTQEPQTSPFLTKAFDVLFPFKYFNPIQSQTFQAVFAGNENVLIAAPSGSGKIVCAEWSMLQLFDKSPDAKCVYVAPMQSVCDCRFRDWSIQFGSLGKSVALLTGDANTDYQLLSSNHIVISTPEAWDMLSRRWKQRKEVREISLFIADELHLVGSAIGPVLEIIVTRMRFIESKGFSIRIIGLAASLANGNDIGGWLGATNIFNFHPSNRPNRLEVELYGFDIGHFGTRMLAMARPVFELVSSRNRSLIFVPTKRQAQVTAIDLVTFAASLKDASFFVADQTALAEQAKRISDPGLKQTLELGVGYLHETMNKGDKAIVEACYETGIIKALVVVYTMAWEISYQTELVVIMGTSKFDGSVSHYVDYPVTDIMQMIGCASSPGAVSKCVVMCHTKKKPYYKKFLHDPLPVESHLNHVLGNHLCAEVVAKTIHNKQDAVDYLTWTFLYRRLTKNPNYYNLLGVDTDTLSDYLSELIENTLNELAESKCILLDDNEMDLSPLNLGIIASFYYVQYSTMEVFSSNIKPESKLRRILDVLTSATEFEDIPVKHHEDRILREISKHSHMPLTDPDFTDSRTKTHLLLQQHFSRSALSTQKQDLDIILSKSLPLVHSIVDIIASNGWLKPAISAMELSQMIVQGRWITDSPLLQIPHFSKEIIDRCTSAGVQKVFDIMDLDDEKRNRILQLSNTDMMDVANFCNSYPDLDLKFEVLNSNELKTGETVKVQVTLDRVEDDEEPEYGKVNAPLFPKPKFEAYWLIVGAPTTNVLYSIKRVNLVKSASIVLEFEAPKQIGTHALKLFLISDSIMGVDEEHDMSISLLQGDQSSSESSDSDSD